MIRDLTFIAELSESFLDLLATLTAMNEEVEKPGKENDASPARLSNLKAKPPETVAAGLKAIEVTTENSIAKMGPIRATRGLLKLNQKGGIDCQSCAWPDPEHRSIAEFCENGSKALADEATKKRITAKFFASNSILELADKDDQWLNAQGRLTEPMVARRGATHYEPISWKDAFAIIAENLNSLNSPDEAIFYTSGRTSNEAAFLYQLFVRQFGTNNLPDCSNMCHESTSVALVDSIGLGKASIGLDDFKQTDLVIVIGQNPGTNAPRMLSSLQDAKKAGAKMIAINPLPEAGLLSFVNPNPQHYHPMSSFPLTIIGDRAFKLADFFLQVKIGGDAAVIKGMMKALFAMEAERPGEVLDHRFISDATSGFDTFLAELNATSWQDIVIESGLTREQITEAAEMFASADRVITCWAMGVTQHKNSVALIQDISNLHFLRGQIGKDGAGLCPVRGHSNVQGDRTMGIWEKFNEKFAVALDREFDFVSPRKDGLGVVESIQAMADRRATVFFAMGGNFLSAAPDTDVVFEALKNCDLTVQVVTKLNRTALATGKTSLILPCLGRSEIDIQEGGVQFVSTESTMLNVQSSQGIFEPVSEHLRSEPWIVAEMAKAVLGSRSKVDWNGMAANYDLIRDSIARVVQGFESYNERIRNAGGFFLPNPPRQRRFNTADGKAKFVASKLERRNIPAGRLLLTTIRSHNQFNTTVYDQTDRYRGIYGERRVILMNEADIAEHSLIAGSVVDITSHFDNVERSVFEFIVVPYPIPKGCAAAYFPEANPLVPLKSFALGSKTPTSKSIEISLHSTGKIAGRFDLK